MSFPNSILIAGTGNLATNLLAALSNYSDFSLSCWGRNQAQTDSIVSLFGISPYSSSNSYDLIILCVSDSAIADVAKKLALQTRALVHCAGSVSIETIAFEGINYGVMWPVQSFVSTQPKSFKEIPVVFESKHNAYDNELTRLIELLGAKPVQLPEKERKQLHLAAIFASNFSNAMYVAAFEWCQINGLNAQLLIPLIEETAKRLQAGNPLDFQTGPARRNDTAVMKEHIEMLNQTPQLKEVYQFISEFILQKFTY